MTITEAETIEVELSESITYTQKSLAIPINLLSIINS